MALERSGYKVVSEEDYYKEIISIMKTEFPNMSENPSNLAVILARVIARRENLRDYDRVNSYSDAYVSTATGIALDKCVRTAGISRVSGFKAVGKVLISKSPKTPQIVIPARMEIETDGLIYSTLNTDAIVLSSPEIEVEIMAKESGTNYNIAYESKFKPVLNIIGIEDIYAITDIEGGTELETDAKLRERYFLRVASYSNSSLKGIIDAVKMVEGVGTVDGIENVTEIEKDGLKPHSFKIFVNGGSDIAVANEIMKIKPAGIQTSGEITVPVEISGRGYDVSFSRFGDRKIYYAFEVVVDKTVVGVDFEKEFKDEVKTYTARNTSIIGYELCAYLSNKLNGIKGIKTMKFGFSENPQTDSSLVGEPGFMFISDDEAINLSLL